MDITIYQMMKMSDVVHNVEYYIIGLPDNWKRISRTVDEFLKSYDPDYEIVDVRGESGKLLYDFDFSENFDGDKETISSIISTLVSSGDDTVTEP